MEVINHHSWLLNIWVWRPKQGLSTHNPKNYTVKRSCLCMLSVVQEFSIVVEMFNYCRLDWVVQSSIPVQAKLKSTTRVKPKFKLGLLQQALKYWLTGCMCKTLCAHNTILGFHLILQHQNAIVFRLFTNSSSKKPKKKLPTVYRMFIFPIHPHTIPLF